MFSYENNKHPGLIIFIILTCMSSFIFLFEDQNTRFMGLLSIVWGVFCLMRFSSLYEAQSFIAQRLERQGPSKLTNHQSGALAYDLTRRRHRLLGYHRAQYALKSINQRSLIWFILALLCALNFTVQNFSMTSIFLIANKLIIISAAFWGAHSYAYSHRASALMTYVFSLIFVLCLLLSTYSLPQYAQSSGLFSPPITVMPVLFLIGYSCISLAQNIKYDLHNILSKASIPLILCILCFLPFNISENFAAYLSGISLISVLWIRSKKQGTKTYILYQCE